MNMDDFALTHWILDARGIAVPERDPKKWAEWMYAENNRLVARTETCHCTVSTVFLGIDHNFMGKLPVLFETMVFQGEMSQHEGDERPVPVDFEGGNSDWVASALWGSNRRYSLKADAVLGHQEVVADIEKQFGQVQDKVSGLLYGIINAEEWVKDQ
jgi:hypothetical protein